MRARQDGRRCDDDDGGGDDVVRRRSGNGKDPADMVAVLFGPLRRRPVEGVERGWGCAVVSINSGGGGDSRLSVGGRDKRVTAMNPSNTKRETARLAAKNRRDRLSREAAGVERQLASIRGYVEVLLDEAHRCGDQIASLLKDAPDETWSDGHASLLHASLSAVAGRLQRVAPVGACERMFEGIGSGTIEPRKEIV
jgi:hypothetical protein